MLYTIAGLGNPGNEYVSSRHNVGREFVIYLKEKVKSAKFPKEWKENKKAGALYCDGTLEKKKVKLLLPDIYMNRSGVGVGSFVKSKKAAEKLVVIHDDLDMPIGAIKIISGKGAGGHRGVASVQKAIKTKNYIRVRVGVSPVTPGGKLKKPKGEKAVVDFILGKFKESEQKIIKKQYKLIAEALEVLVTEGLGKAMSYYN